MQDATTTTNPSRRTTRSSPPSAARPRPAHDRTAHHPCHLYGHGHRCCPRLTATRRGYAGRDNNYQPKPAYNAVVTALGGPASPRPRPHRPPPVPLVRPRAPVLPAFDRHPERLCRTRQQLPTQAGVQRGRHRPRRPGLAPPTTAPPTTRATCTATGTGAARV